MPFIRYEQGDMASWLQGCSCDICLPAIALDVGRTMHCFVRRNGEIFAPQLPDPFMEDLQSMFWQAAQVSRDVVELRYRPKGQRDPAVERQYAERIRQHFQEDFEIRFVVVDTMPLTNAGKFIKYRNEIV